MIYKFVSKWRNVYELIGLMRIIGENLRLTNLADCKIVIPPTL